MNTISQYIPWAPVVGRIILGLIFVHSAYYKIPGTEMFGFQVQTSDAAGIPLPVVAVTLAFLFELIGGLALVFGWHTRVASVALMLLVVLIAFFFGRNFSDMQQFMTFFSCLQLLAALLYIFGFGPGKLSLDNRRSQVAAAV